VPFVAGSARRHCKKGLDESKGLKTRHIWFLIAIFSPLGIAALPGWASADAPPQAGLVVVYGDGRLESHCVSLPEGEVSGADLLLLSGLDVALDTGSSMGITLCQVEGVGCDFPAEPCFCQCMGGGECTYWNYFYRDPGQEEWVYSALGAALRQVSPGSVEAWVWGDGQTPPAAELSFEAICPPPTPTAPPQPPTAVPTAEEVTASPPAPTLIPTAAPTAVAPSPPPMPTDLPSAAVAPGPAVAPERGLSSYWPFGLMLLVLAGIGVALWLRRT